MLRTSALRGGLAATALLAVSVGCTVQPGADGAPPDAKPGGGSPLGVSIAPLPDPPVTRPESTPATTSPTPAADRTSAAPPSAPPRTPAPPPTRPSPSVPKPATLMAVGAQSDQVRELQARLRQIGHFDRSPTGYYGTVTATAVSSFQGKRGLPLTGTTDTVTWQRLLGMTKQPTRDELRPPTEKPVAKPDPRCMKGRVMCISKKSSTLAWMVDGKVKSAMDVRFGSEYTPTREGLFSVGWKSRDHVSTLYDSPMPYAMFFSGGQAVHYSSDFAARGYEGASHGCVNVRDEKKVAALFEQVKAGDKVVIYW
ncbi:L,D-transpeptidase family protein [Streptomyces corynorhini]|uniref:Murein L,D-transpeptidase n=1 Tax=Streptomyces corynorhini TaxID=2282652 RepID=A0A370AZ42_9ACTN|nr:L,D-transpeptidase family protein [Streptomyces corynorhini]RDG34927.1 murein L,D-transpeptidase [Streptomyces corynorhini]